MKKVKSLSKKAQDHSEELFIKQMTEKIRKRKLRSGGSDSSDVEGEEGKSRQWLINKYENEHAVVPRNKKNMLEDFDKFSSPQKLTQNRKNHLHEIMQGSTQAWSKLTNPDFAKTDQTEVLSLVA